MKIENSFSKGMHYALIAAGEGSRLKEEGIETPKPLVKIMGLPMVERLIRIFMQNGARSISVICNEQMTEVQSSLEKLRDSDLLLSVDENGKPFRCPLNIVVQTTPSSMHSLAALAGEIPSGRFCLTTVDTIFSEADFSAFIHAYHELDDAAEGLFAVTPFVDDEKPLWVGVNPQENFSCACAKNARQRILGFYDREELIPAEEERMVSGGIYCLDTRTAFPVLEDCLAKGQSRMRNFQRALIAAGLRLDAYVFPKIMDIDHASDIEKAELWLAQSRGNLLTIARDTVYSPNNETKDAAIWQLVIRKLQQRGWHVDERTESAWVEMDVEAVAVHYQKIFHMARRMRSLMRLERLTVPVINEAFAVRTVAKSRELTLTKLEQNGIPIPTWWSYDPEEDEMFVCEPHLQKLLPAWIKAMREDGAKPEDVCFVRTPLEADTGVLQFASQNVPDIVAMQHEEGDLVKCYVVLDGENAETPTFLRWYYPQETGYSKFGVAETQNSPLSHYPISEEKVASLAMAVGRALGLQIFGFDMIVKSDGKFCVIDVNDWPSFSFCREEAAEAIAEVIDKN